MSKREAILANHVVDLSAAIAAFLVECPMPLGVAKSLEELLARSRRLVPELEIVVTKRGKLKEVRQ